MARNAESAPKQETRGDNPADHAQPAQRPRKARAPNAPPMVATNGAGGAATKNSDAVYNELRNAIITMKLPPGTPINEKDLTRRYGISRTPVREAVLRLAEDRLIDVVPKSGTFVARIPVATLREALVARRALEAVIVREATKKASESQFLELRAILQRQRETAEAGDEAAFHKADNDFHSSIATAGRLAGIWDMIQQIRIQIERYRRLTLPQPGRMLKVVSEHEAVADAMARRDADAAVEHMLLHLDKLQLDIAVFRDQWPDYFVFDPTVDAELLAD